MHKYKFILSICSFFLLGNINGQDLITTNSGQKILVKNNGSWEAIERDAALDENGEITTESTTNANVFELPTESKVSLTDAQSTEIQTIIKLLEEKEGHVAVSIHQGLKYISKLNDRVFITEKADKKRLKKLIKEQEKSNNKNDQYYAKTTHFIASLRDLSNQKPNDVDKKLGYLKAKIEVEYDLDLPAMSNVASQAEFMKKINYTTTFKPSPNVKGPKDPFECRVTFNGKDPISGKRKKEIAGATLFTFTQDKLKPYFKEDDFLTCESIVTKVGKNYYVTLNFRLKSKDASRTYGSLKAKEEMRIEFIDGAKIYGTNILQSNGEIEPYSGHTIFSGVYQFDKEEIDQLGRKLIDNVGVLWSSGFEQYDVYNVDLLKNQINCLKKG